MNLKLQGVETILLHFACKAGRTAFLFCRDLCKTIGSEDSCSFKTNKIEPPVDFHETQKAQSAPNIGSPDPGQ